MAEKISVEIGLDGGAEVVRQLEDIGQAGQKTFTDIQNAADQVDLSSISQNVQAAVQGAAALEQVVQGIKKVEGAFDALGTAATRMASRMTRSSGALGVFARALGPVGIAVGVAAGAFIKFGNDSAKALASLTVEAAKLDLTAQKFDTLQTALTRLGVSADTVIPGLQKFKESLAGEFFPVDTITGLRNFIAVLERMPDGLERNKLAIDKLGEALGGQVIAGLQTGTLGVETFRNALASVTPATQEQINQANRYQQSLNQLSAAWTELKGVMAPILTPLFQLVTGEIKALISGVNELIASVKELWNFLSALAGVFTAQGPDQMTAAVNRLTAAYNQLGTAAAQAAQKTGGVKTGGNISAAGFASGGLLGGRGSGTSDSNLAWVSRGEYITPARAVAQPGVLSFLEALRRSGGNLSRVLDGMGRFALGGMVPRMPAYAAGGLAGGSNVTIQFPGLPAIGGLRASSSVVEQLHKAAALAQVRSGGRKPSRYS